MLQPIADRLEQVVQIATTLVRWCCSQLGMYRLDYWQAAVLRRERCLCQPRLVDRRAVDASAGVSPQAIGAGWVRQQKCDGCHTRTYRAAFLNAVMRAVLSPSRASSPMVHNSDTSDDIDRRCAAATILREAANSLGSTKVVLCVCIARHHNYVDLTHYDY